MYVILGNLFEICIVFLLLVIVQQCLNLIYNTNFHFVIVKPKRYYIILINTFNYLDNLSYLFES